MSAAVVLVDQPTETAATYQKPDVAVQMSGTDYGRLSHDDIFEVLRLSARGLSQRKIAEIVGCSQPTVCYTLQRAKADPETIKGLLRITAPDMVGVWAEKARKAPDHRGAKELVEAAYDEIRSQGGRNAGGGGVTVNIGIAGQPLRVPDITISASPARLSPPVSDDFHSVTVDSKAVDVA